MFSSFSSFEKSSHIVQEITSSQDLDRLLSSATTTSFSTTTATLTSAGSAAPAYIVAKFYSDTCQPCRNIAQPFENLAESYIFPKGGAATLGTLGTGPRRAAAIEARSRAAGIGFVKVNTARVGDLSRRYEIKYVPTFIIFHKGNVVAKKSLSSESELRYFVSQHFKPCPSTTSSAFGSSRGYRLGGAEDNEKKATGSGPFGFRGLVGGGAAEGGLRVGGSNASGLNIGNVGETLLQLPSRLALSLPTNWIGMGVRFVLLYFISLFATNAREAATTSVFATV